MKKKTIKRNVLKKKTIKRNVLKKKTRKTLGGDGRTKMLPWVRVNIKNLNRELLSTNLNAVNLLK